MSMISPAHMSSQDYVYNTRDAANFAAFTPIFWCLFLGWIIFVSYIGQAGTYGSLGGTYCWHWSCMILDTSVTYHFAFLKPGLLPMCGCKSCVNGSQLSYRSSKSPQAVLGQCNFKAFIQQRWTSVSLPAIFLRQHGTSCALVKCKILQQWQCKPASFKIAHYCTHTCHQVLAVAHSVWLLWQLYHEVWSCVSYCGCCTQKLWI